MRRREFLAAGFKLGAAGLLLPFIEPARRVWALNRTMTPGPILSFTGGNMHLTGTTLPVTAMSRDEWVVYWTLAKTMTPFPYSSYLDERIQ